MANQRLFITGFVLAGGSSRRMGRPKEMLVVAGETMLSRQLRLLCAVSRSVAVVGWRGIGPGWRTSNNADNLVDCPAALPDLLPGRGPLAGIYTGLSWTRTEFNLFLGCDLPFIELRFLRYLSKLALSCQADVTVPVSREHGYQPLCAVYRRRALPLIRASLARGENKVSRFFPDVHCRVVSWPELARTGFRARMFDNMNTPEDYEAAQRRLNAEAFWEQ
jgi:molybdenum cofactor guanylyltransferase